MAESENKPRPFVYSANFQSPVTKVLQDDPDKKAVQSYINRLLGMKDTAAK